MAVCFARLMSALLFGSSLMLFLSGAAGLCWQFVWTAQWSVLLGHEYISVLAVMAAFFGGLCLGSALFAKYSKPTHSTLKVYLIAECVVAVWGLCISFFLPHFSGFAADLIGTEPVWWWHASVAFVFPLLLLLPATMAMGLTLPALEKHARDISIALPVLYAANTLGAFFGVVLAVAFALPVWGLKTTALVAAGLNLFCCVLAWVQTKSFPKNSLQPIGIGASETPHTLRGRNYVGLKMAALGILGIAYEVLTVRVLSQVNENTVYSYASTLGVYLIFNALGAATYPWFLKLLPAINKKSDIFFAGLLISLLAGGLGLYQADYINNLSAIWFGRSYFSALLAEAITSVTALALPAYFMGLVFSDICMQAKRQHIFPANLFAWNIFGATVAPLLTGIFLIPQTGLLNAWLLILSGYSVLQRFQLRTVIFKILPLAVGLCMAFYIQPQGFPERTDKQHTIFHREGVLATVSITEDAYKVARLQINHRVQEGSSAAGLVEWRLAALPLMWHEQPESVLLLGLGTGFTALAAAQWRDIHIEAVELLPEVIEASKLFDTYPNRPQPVSPIHTVNADARRYVQATTHRYDVIISDLFHPARSGAGSLYTTEHFQSVKEKLNPDGVFCQWLALHQMDIDTLRHITASYVNVFPDAIAVLASNSLDSPVIGLMSRNLLQAQGFDETMRRISTNTPLNVIHQTQLNNAFAVAGSLVASNQSLRNFSSSSQANTDDLPLVSFKAPLTTYAPQDTPRQRLAYVLSEWKPDDGSLDINLYPRHLMNYWQARNAYLEFGMTVKPLADSWQMLQVIKDKFLALLVLSPDFTPAYIALQQLTQQVADEHPQDADLLIQKLNHISKNTYERESHDKHK